MGWTEGVQQERQSDRCWMEWTTRFSSAMPQLFAEQYFGRVAFSKIKAKRAFYSPFSLFEDAVAMNIYIFFLQSI